MLLAGAEAPTRIFDLNFIKKWKSLHTEYMRISSNMVTSILPLIEIERSSGKH